MNVLIYLSSTLLAQALAFMINADEEGLLRGFVYEDVQGGDDLVADVVVFDCFRCDPEIFSRWPDARHVMIDTGDDQKKTAILMIANNIDGVVSLNTGYDLFKKAIRAVCEGQIWIDQKNIKFILRNTGAISQSNSILHLSDKDKKIAELITEGRTNREIAERLFLCEQTIKAHVSQIFKKLGVSNRSQLVSLVMKNS